MSQEIQQVINYSAQLTNSNTLSVKASGTFLTNGNEFNISTVEYKNILYVAITVNLPKMGIQLKPSLTFPEYQSDINVPYNCRNIIVTSANNKEQIEEFEV